jgi:hypothetical protein
VRWPPHPAQEQVIRTIRYDLPFGRLRSPALRGPVPPHRDPRSAGRCPVSRPSPSSPTPDGPSKGLDRASPSPERSPCQSHARGQRSGPSPSPRPLAPRASTVLTADRRPPNPLPPPRLAPRVRPRPRRCATSGRSPRLCYNFAISPLASPHQGPVEVRPGRRRCATTRRSPRSRLPIGSPTGSRRHPRPLCYKSAISPLTPPLEPPPRSALGPRRCATSCESPRFLLPIEAPPVSAPGRRRCATLLRSPRCATTSRSPRFALPPAPPLRDRRPRLGRPRSPIVTLAAKPCRASYCVPFRRDRRFGPQ